MNWSLYVQLLGRLSQLRAVIEQHLAPMDVRMYGLLSCIILDTPLLQEAAKVSTADTPCMIQQCIQIVTAWKDNVQEWTFASVTINC